MNETSFAALAEGDILSWKFILDGLLPEREQEGDGPGSPDGMVAESGCCNLPVFLRRLVSSHPSVRF